MHKIIQSIKLYSCYIHLSSPTGDKISFFRDFFMYFKVPDVKPIF
jgi:hypothetical protein